MHTQEHSERREKEKRPGRQKKGKAEHDQGERLEAVTFIAE